jgi:hypothetical protein
MGAGRYASVLGRCAARAQAGGEGSDGHG